MHFHKVIETLDLSLGESASVKAPCTFFTFSEEKEVLLLARTTLLNSISSKVLQAQAQAPFLISSQCYLVRKILKYKRVDRGSMSTLASDIK